MQRDLSRITEAMPLPCWHDHGLSFGQRGAFVGEPYLGLSGEDGQDLLDSVQVSRGTTARIAPLLEDAQALSTGLSGDAYLSDHARPPLLALLCFMIDDLHGALGGSPAYPTPGIVHFVSSHQIHRAGIDPVLDLIEPGSNLLITFDCDGLDPSIMPGVIGRVPGGLTYWQAVDLLSGAAKRARIASFDLVEFMPSRDVDELGALVAGRILATVLGLVLRQAALRSG
jgi:hypothetical protein